MAEEETTIREAVAVFHTEKDLQAAIDDLLTHGFDRSEISLLAGEAAIEKKLGQAYRSVRDLEDDGTVPTIAYASSEAFRDARGAVIGSLLYVGALAGIVPVVASGGAVAAVLAAAAIGGGAGVAVGSALSAIIGRRHADYIEDQLQHGGLLLWVRTWTPEDEAKATDILKAHSGSDVHIHGLPNTPMPQAGEQSTA